MLDRAACERRVYRLATLLTGNPIAATKVIEQVVDAQPDLRNLDSAHMDRLTVLRSREIAPATLVDQHVPPEIAAAVAGLTAQQREAWVLANVYRVPQREIARAMDCSVTATQRHLEAAAGALDRKLDAGAAAAPTTLLAFSLALEVPRFYRIEQRRRRHLRLALIVMAAAAGSLLIAAIVLWWSRPLGNT
jgi:hypothetical protein